MRYLLALIGGFLCLANDVIANGFVEEVSCSSASLTIVLNQSDPDLAKWIMEPNARPIVYVLDHDNIRECGSMIKANGSLNLHLQIPYGPECNVNLVNLEPNHISAETTIVIEDFSSRNSQKINHVYCLYTKTVATLKFNDVSSGHTQVESTGSRPKPKVEMLFRGQGGNPLRAAKLGDIVEFYVALSPDGAYRGIAPRECRFADREDTESPDAKHFTFVNDGCPVEGTNELIDPLQNVNQEVYFSKFKTFRFGNQSTVFAHCTVQVCLEASECLMPCFTKVMNSSLTAERLRYRHKRSATTNEYDKFGELHLKNQITILDGQQARQVTALNQKAAEEEEAECQMSPYSANTTMLTVIAVLSVICVALTTVILVIWMRKRRADKDSFDLYTASSYASTTLCPAPSSYPTAYPVDSYTLRSHPRPYVHHLGRGEGTFR